MSDRIENFDEITPRQCYDEGYDEGLKRGLEMVEIERLKHQHLERHVRALSQAIADHNRIVDILNPKPIIVSEEHWGMRLQGSDLTATSVISEQTEIK